MASGTARRGSHARGEQTRWGRRLLAALGVVVLVVGGGSLVALKVLQRNIRTLDLTPALGTDRPSAAAANPDGDRAINFVVMGSDSRDGDNGFIGGKEDGARSDTTLVVHLSADRTWAAGVSIPRDSVVEVPECLDSATELMTPSSRRMFNDAFLTGGPACTVRSVESLTGLRIDHWVVVDFSGFKSVVDALGTVPICLAEPVEDPKHGIHLPAGRSEVDGTTALAYVRERYKIGDGGDLGRIERQQAFLSSVLQKATSAGTLANPARTFSFLNAVTKSLVMDPELSSLPRLASFAQDVQKVGLKKIRFITVPNGPDPEDANRLVWTDDAETLWAALRDDRPVDGSGSTPTPTPTRDDGATPEPSSSGASASPSATGVALGGVTVRTADADICPT